MNKLKGAAIIGQSGGPTSVINASAAGVFIARAFLPAAAGTTCQNGLPE